MDIARASFVLLLLGCFGASARRLHGLCDFETEDICGLTGNHHFKVQSGRPGFNTQSMTSGFAGSGYLLLDQYNSESTIQTPYLKHSEESIDVGFAYFLNGNGGDDSYVKAYWQVSGGELQEFFSTVQHKREWFYVNSTIQVPFGESFKIVWKVFADANTWTQAHDWLGLDYIKVTDNGIGSDCYRPPPVQYANPWSCVPPQIIDGSIGDANEALPDGTICTSSCEPEFIMQGQPIVHCVDGNWQELGEIIFLCIDVTAPKFNPCPTDLYLETPFGWGSMWYTISPPEITDNTGAFNVEMYIDGTLQSETTLTSNISPGSHSIQFVATDLFMNQNTCEYDITITAGDQEPPFVVSCPSSSYIESEFPLPITWSEPVFDDDSGYIERVESTYESGVLLAWGLHEVVYPAYDNSSNSATCSFTITIQGKSCDPLNLPIKGAIACHDSYAGSFCVSMCGETGDFYLPSAEFSVPEDYLCSSSGNWYPYTFTYNCNAERTSETTMPSQYYYQGLCNQTSARDQIRHQALDIYNYVDPDQTLGTDLTVDDFYVRCGQLE